jgi:PleD family two-component response regulator
MSVGISEFSIYDKSNEDLIKRADEALYYAKENGRDRVIIYEEIYKKEKK